MSNIQTQRQSEKGNVLFLILIAVALFAALSYVVTQSTRSGGGSTEREKNILSSAQMTQYPTALRTSIIRMVLAGVAIENIKFDAPGDPGFAPAQSIAQLVFHPQGGGATYQEAPTELSASGNTQLSWTYNAAVEVPGIGIDDEGGNDVIAFLPGISDGVCRQVNEELGIDTSEDVCGAGVNIPVVSTAGIEAAVDSIMDVNQASFPDGSGSITLTPATCTTIFNRQASGCFKDGEASPTRNVFYSVLLER
jgi:hypothetical protein